MSRRSLYILGSGGLARETASLVEKVNRRARRWRFEGFIGPPTPGPAIGDDDLRGDDEWLARSGLEADLVLGIGSPQVRAKLYARFAALGFGFPVLVHPDATIDSDRVDLGPGTVLTAGVRVTCDVIIGAGSVLNLNATVGHDAIVGHFAVVNPGANLSGGVWLGDRVLVGTGAQLLERVQVGADATVGAGAVVRADVAAGATVVGVPAKPLRPAAVGAAAPGATT